MMDAIAVKLPLTDKHITTLRDYPDSTRDAVQKSFIGVQQMGFKDIPVVCIWNRQKECRTKQSVIKCGMAQPARIGIARLISYKLLSLAMALVAPSQEDARTCITFLSILRPTPV